MFKLQCTAQNYAWGRPAADSEVAALHGACGGKVEPSQPYAELWMGSHPSGPSYIAGTNTTLLSWVKANPECLGDVARSTFGEDLPFLFKVLSVNTALSIQSHPDKSLAQRLHAERPNVYKDPNHKPEMALALTPFEAMSSFRCNDELVAMFKLVPELGECIAADAINAFCAAPSPAGLKTVFSQLMTSAPETYKAAVDGLVARLSQKRARVDCEALALRLAAQYPGDVGVLASFFLNHVTLAPGEAIALEANEPHAYVSGQCVECMAASDNVVRAGLTPKLRDTEVLCSSLTYTQGAPEVLSGEDVSKHTKVYRPPFEEFEVLHTLLPAEGATTLRTVQGPMLLLVQEGQGSMAAFGGALDGHSDLLPSACVSRGDVMFVPAGTLLDVRASSGSALRLWGATCNRALYPGAPPLADDVVCAPTKTKGTADSGRNAPPRSRVESKLVVQTAAAHACPVAAR